MTRKLSIKKPTHRLMHGDTCYALVRCGRGNGAAIQLLSTGETERSASFLCDCDLLMGRWQNAVFYMFGAAGDHIPSTATLVPVTA